VTNQSNQRLSVAANLPHDRRRGPEIRETRITVHNLLQNFLYQTQTEAAIRQIDSP